MKRFVYAFMLYAGALVAQQHDSLVMKSWATYPLVASTQFAASYIISLASLANKTKEINRSGLYQLSRSDSYAPKSVGSGNPMFKVTASGVVIDLNGMEIKNEGTSNLGFIGIEIGYAPSESGTQPTDVIIQNGTLTGFDLGILVHAGVKNVLIKNVQINGSSVGVACLGTSSVTASTAVVSCTLEQVRITGHNQNKQDALVALKTIIETGSGNYNYGSNAFMPLRDDSVAGGDTNDVYTYYGILATYARNVVCKNCVIENIGYGGYDEGATNRTEAVGVCLRNCVHAIVQNSFVQSCKSQLKAVGMQLELVNDMSVVGCQINSNISQKKAVGIECYQETPSGYNVENIIITDTQCNMHSSDDTSYGIDASYVRDLTLQQSTCNRNYGAKTAIGLYSTKLHAASLLGTALQPCQMNANYTDTSALATADGALASGIKLSGATSADVASIVMQYVQTCSNVGYNSGRGIYIKNASSVQLADVQSSLNEGTALRTDEATDLIGLTGTVTVPSHDQATNSISRHLPVLTQTGGVGVWLEGVTHVQAERVKTTYNKGVRATGILVRDSSDIKCISCTTSSQQATGECFSSSLASQDATSFAVKSAHKNLLFGNASIATMSVKAATDDYLTKVGLVVADHASNESYANMKMLLNAMQFLQGGVARYRVWGTAVGLHAHNVVGLYVDSLHALKNNAAKDSAMGLACTGLVQGCEIRNSSLSYNTAWSNSVRSISSEAYAYTYDMAAVLHFWDMLADANSIAGNPDADGEWEHSTGSTVQGFATGSGAFTARGAGLKIQLNGTARVLANPVGPMAVGCLLADAALDVVLEGNVICGNNGNSGIAFGIALSNAFSTMLLGNGVFNTYANNYGIAYGIVDFTTHSATVALNNKLAGNRWSDYTNANYVIPFNASDVTSSAYQTTSTYNGNLSNADSMNTVENLDVKYSTDATYFYKIKEKIDPFVTSDFVTQWTTQSWKSS